MFNKLAAIFLIDKPRLMKTPRMLAYGFFIRPKRFNNTIKSYFPARRYNKQYLDAIMVRHSLEMPLHLFSCFYLPHTYIINNTPTYSSL